MGVKRVLQVLASLNRGGAESMIMNIYRNINKERIQFDFLVNESNEDYDFEAEIKKLGGRIFQIPKYNILNHYKYKEEWRRLLQKHSEWKIIHGHHTTPATIYIDIAENFERTTIGHSHIAGSEFNLKSFLKRMLRYPIRYKADYLFACSKLAAKWMFGTKSKYAKIIHNAISTEKFEFDKRTRQKKRKELGIDGKYIIGHVGRFAKQKNHTYLIDIFYQLKKINTEVCLLLIGDGELKNDIKKKVNKLNLSNNIKFAGVRGDVDELLQAIDVFVLPSLYEGLPVTLVEAQCSGLKIFASDTITDEVDITDLVNFLSINQDPANWALSINDSLEKLSNQERSRYAVELSKSNYSINKTANELENFYLNID